MRRARAGFDSWPGLPGTSGRDRTVSRRRLVQVVAAGAIIWATLAPGTPIRFVMATAGHLHTPARMLADLIRPRRVSPEAPPSSRSIRAAVRAFYAAGMPTTAPRSGHHYLATAILERDASRGILVLDAPTGSLRGGDAVMVRDTLAGFVASGSRAGLVVANVRRADVVLRVRILLPDGGEVHALAEGVARQPDRLVLRYPERPSLLRAGLPVLTIEQPATPMPAVSSDSGQWRVDVPGDRLLGRLAVDSLRSEGAYRAFMVVADDGWLDEWRAAVESSMHDPTAPPYPGREPAAYRKLSTGFRGGFEVAGTGLEITAGLEAGVARGESVSSSGSFLGRIDAVGLLESRVRRPLDGGLVLSVLSIEAGRVRRHRLDFAPAAGQFRSSGPSSGPAAGAWLVTAGADPGIPAGLLVGQISGLAPDGKTGQCRFIPLADGPVTVWSRRRGAREDG